ncbi:MAG: hypothetical protein JW910_17410, partial [Anaerolineae bacterium]|nr:hypothetical protein [Anaerolineae bacterium]
YGVSTEGYPPKDSNTHKATAAECDQALQALKDGKDVEMNGAGHCAALVGMAKLSNGKYVMYVAHDTDQGNEGGTKIEKVIYDPSLETPTAEGGWGFNGKLINGFVAEWAEAASTTTAKFSQTDFLLEDVPTIDSEWGELEVTYDASSGNGVQYLNLSLDGEWVMQNVPVRDPDAGGEVTLVVPFAVTGDPEPGEEWVESFFDVFVTIEPLAEMPGGNYLCTVGDGQFTMDSGEDGVALVYSGPTTDPLWWINSGYTDAAFHPWGRIVNQDCGKNECAPAAVSNSLKMLKASNPQAMSGLADNDLGTGTMRGACGTSAGGSPAGPPDTAGAWWNLKKAWMNARENYPIKTDMVTDKSKMDDIMQAIRDGKDVELRIPGHVMMVTGVVKLADGTYVLEVAHDTNQGAAGGTVIELVKFNPATGKFSGPSWINGVDFTNGTNNGAMFVVESVSTLNVKQTDYTINGVTVTDSGWGEVTFTHTQDSTEVEFFNMSVEGSWTVQNLPLPVLTPGQSQPVTLRYNLGVPDGTPVHEISYGYSMSPGLQSAAPNEQETGLIDPGVFNMSNGETSGSILYSPPAGEMVWCSGSGLLPDFAFHDSDTIVNQDCGNNECAPAAVSNSLKMLQNQNPTEMGGLDDSDIGIGAMKPVTDWGAGGAPAGDLDDIGSWWNWKQLMLWLDPDIPIDTQIIGDKADFGDVVDAIRDGKDVELRVPGHVVMVTGAMELPNGDYVLWVAHDTNQGPDGNGGTVVEPVYYDSSTNTFYGPGWINGQKFSSPGDTQALFVVESVDTTEIEFLLDLPTHGMGTEGDPYDVPNSVPVACTVYHNELGDVTASSATAYLFDPPMAGSVVGHNIVFNPAYMGIATVSAHYNERPVAPYPMVFNVNYTPPANSLFCWPGETTPEEGDVITVTVYANQTASPLAVMPACRVVWPIGSPYAPGTFNIGQYGGEVDYPDGVWEEYAMVTDILYPSDAGISPTELPPTFTTWGYDFYVEPVSGPEFPLVTGALFNFGVEVHSDLAFSFQEWDGALFHTWYENLASTMFFWGDITNAGAPIVDMQ